MALEISINRKNGYNGFTLESEKSKREELQNVTHTDY